MFQSLQLTKLWIIKTTLGIKLTYNVYTNQLIIIMQYLNINIHCYNNFNSIKFIVNKYISYIY